MDAQRGRAYVRRYWRTLKSVAEMQVRCLEDRSSSATFGVRVRRAGNRTSVVSHVSFIYRQRRLKDRRPSSAPPAEERDANSAVPIFFLPVGWEDWWLWVAPLGEADGWRPLRWSSPPVAGVPVRPSESPDLTRVIALRAEKERRWRRNLSATSCPPIGPSCWRRRPAPCLPPVRRRAQVAVR
jgi:hypothetical protein